jgi:hypothetical protein
MSTVPGKPYSYEFLLENQDKILMYATNGQMLEMLDELRTFLEGRGLGFNAGIVNEARRRLKNFDDFMTNCVCG